VYARDSGESGSAGGPGTALGKRMDMGGGGYIAPRVPATTDATDTAARVPKVRRDRRGGGAVENVRERDVTALRCNSLINFEAIIPYSSTPPGLLARKLRERCGCGPSHRVRWRQYDAGGCATIGKNSHSHRL